MSSVIEVPDWYRTVALVGVDITGEPVVVLLDSTGAIMAVMKGEYAGTLKNIAVDASGRIVSVIRDPTSDNYIAIDANGYIAAVLKATYSGVLKDVACDASGRIIMIPTDPADVWGNAISMGNAELSAIFSFAKQYDRRGNVLALDGFENGLGRWQAAKYGTGADMVLSSAYANFGSYSMCLITGADNVQACKALLRFPYPRITNIGYQLSFALHNNLYQFYWEIHHFDGVNDNGFFIAYDNALDKLKYLNSAGVWTDIATGFQLYQAHWLFNTSKLVVSLTANEYIRLQLNDVEYDLSGLGAYIGANVSPPHLLVTAQVVGNLSSNLSSYVDSVVITQNEPANP